MAGQQLYAGSRITAAYLNSIGPLQAVRASTQTVTSSTVLINDDTLFLPLAANATYLITAGLYFNGAVSPAGGMKFGWTLPAGASGFNMSIHGDNSLNFTGFFASTWAGTVTCGTNGSPNNVAAADVKGPLVTSTAGTLQLQWAQGASNATGTQMQVGSYLAAWRLQ